MLAPGQEASDTAARFEGAQLLETLLHTPDGGFFLLSHHLERILASAAALGWADGSSEELLQRCLEEAAAAWQPASASRVRLLLPRDGSPRVERTALAAQSANALPYVGSRCLHRAGLESPCVTVVLDSAPVERADPRLRHKSTARSPYDAARKRAGVGGPVPDGQQSSGMGPTERTEQIFDVILFNEDGELTESSICNVAICQPDGRWLTPPVASGLLAGCFRRMLLGAGELHEAVLPVSELREAVQQGRQVVLFNSVRGAFSVRVLLPDPAH